MVSPVHPQRTKRKRLTASLTMLVPGVLQHVPAWQQPPEPNKLPGESPSNGLGRGGSHPDPSRTQNVPWTVPHGHMMTAGDNNLGHPLQASYYPPTGLLPGYPPPPQYVGFAPAPGQYQPQVVIIGSNHEVVQLQAVENFCGHIVLACFVTWFCNIVLGLVAFALAGMLFHLHYC